jgi:PAS domain S-box-containing protein
MQQDVIMRTDRSSRITFVNDAFCRMFGVTREAMLDTTALDQRYIIFHPDDVAETTAAIRKLYKPPYRSSTDNRARTPRGWRWISWGACAILDAAGTIVEIQSVGRDVTERREAEEALRASLEDLRRSEEKLRLLAQRQALVREEERKRLGFDLHDDVCQELIGIGILVESLRRRLAPLPEGAEADITRVGRYLNELVEHLRLLARDLQPMMLRDLGLEGSLRSLADGLSSAKTRVTAEFTTAIPRLGESTEVAVYRIAQEALTNATRHASANTIVLRLGVTDGTLCIEVRDDGCGFGPEARQHADALGLVSMEERALALGGRFDLCSTPGVGTNVRLECPAVTRASATAA